MQQTAPRITFILAMLLTIASTCRATTDSPQVSQAKKHLADAQTELSRAKIAMTRIINKVTKDLEATPEWKAAMAEVNAAQAKQAAAVHAAQQNLRKDTGYQAALADRAKLQGEREALRNSANPSSDQLAETAVALLNATTVVSHMESQALAADPAVSEARGQLEAANQKLDALRKTLPDLAKKDPGYEPARQKLEQASNQVKDAAKQVDDAKKQQEKDDDQKLNDEINRKRDQLPGLFRR